MFFSYALSGNKFGVLSYYFHSQQSSYHFPVAFINPFPSESPLKFSSLLNCISGS